MAALRVLLARELQHDGSSDRDVCAAVRVFSGAYFHEHYALAPELGALLGQRILNILEQARTDNILCRRFPGYLPLLRFVCYAQLDAAAPGSALEALLDELEAFALTGIRAGRRRCSPCARRWRRRSLRPLPPRARSIAAKRSRRSRRSLRACAAGGR